jgi:release factor glutamine methyltransferase
MRDYSETVPVQYEEGKASFLGMDIMVDERVLIPRPETELLVETIADLCKKAEIKKPFILDVGTGSGIISLGLVKLIKDSSIVALDVSGDALCVAQENITHFKAEERIELIESDMFDFLGEEYVESFDCIVSNPPYVSSKDFEKLDDWVKSEPRIALYAGEEGMDYLNTLAERAGKFLKRGGFLAVECGYDQAEKVKKKFTECGFTSINFFKDFNNYDRVVVGWKRG